MKAVKPKKVINKLDIQDNHNNSKVKDNAKLEELTKNNFDSKNMKMEKLSLKYNSALKRNLKIVIFQMNQMKVVAVTKVIIKIL